MDKPICLCDRCGEAMHCLLNYDGKACRKNRTVEPNNADRIRAMSDKELAKLISSDWCDIACSPETQNCNMDCIDKILDWLRREVKE